MTQTLFYPISGALRRMGIHTVWDGGMPPNTPDDYQRWLDSGGQGPSWEELWPYIEAEQVDAAKAKTLAELTATDKDMARATEDVVDYIQEQLIPGLVASGALTAERLASMAGFPKSLLDKISARKALREKL